MTFTPDTPHKIQEPHPTKFNIISLILALYKGHLPCSRTPRTVTMASRSMWSLMLLTVEQTPVVMGTAVPILSPTTTHFHRSASEPRCSPHHTLTHLNSVHTTGFSKAATHQKMYSSQVPFAEQWSREEFCKSKLWNSSNYIYRFYTMIELRCQQWKDDGILSSPFVASFNELWSISIMCKVVKIINKHLQINDLIFCSYFK